jgi:hypothetical protein
MGKLFSYLCQKYFEGHADQLNEIRIAQDVFGRAATFDRSQDSIARVEAHRLRKKLRQFYEAEGRDHDVQVELPAGSYVPVFRHLGDIKLTDASAPASDAARDDLSAAKSLINPPVGAADPVRKEEPAAPGKAPRRISSWPVTPAWAVYAIILAAVALALFAVWRSRENSRRVTSSNITALPKTRAIQSPIVAASGVPIRILCGYDGPPHINRMGEVWGADKYFRGGAPWPPQRSRFIRGTSDPSLFESTRRGEFSYNIPAKPGFYELHLHFVETEYGEDMGGGENSRTFVIRLNGAPLLSPFDPLSDAGGPWIADERVFKDVQPAQDGMVHISFESQRGQPMISALELLPGQPHQMLPIRLVTQLSSYTDHAGRLWAPDNYYIGGLIFGDKPEVRGTPDPGMFRTERAGNFRYVIPVDPGGTYTANLYFAETYFGAGASGIGGVGGRVFNVMCNGVMLLNQFDVFKQAGSVKAVERSFHGMKPDPHGKLQFWFDPAANYASVFAIEVLDETQQ